MARDPSARPRPRLRRPRHQHTRRRALHRLLLLPQPARNHLPSTIARSFYPDWEIVATATVAGLRLNEGAAPQDPRLREVVARLLATRPDFDRMWQRNDPRGKRLESKRFLHPETGPLTLHVQAFDVRASPGQELVVYSAEPDTVSAHSLNRLAALAALPPLAAQS